MPLLRRAEKEVKIRLEKRIEVFLTHLRQCDRFVATSRLQAIPVQCSDLPIEDLEFARFPSCILEVVKETKGELADDLKCFSPAIVVE